jgi:dihydropteroate synthase
LEIAMFLQCGRKRLDLSRPVIMGILNTTPDSFSDGGKHYTGDQLSIDAALRTAEQHIRNGAAIIDVGGESTRPGAAPVLLERELLRVVPVVEAICREFDVVVSVDTSSPEVMLAAARVGAGMLNDVRALMREGALAAAAATDLPVCLMHMRGQPDGMQQSPQYTDVVVEVRDFLRERIAVAEAAGIAPRNIVVDPGYGFGKTAAHNLALLQQQALIAAMGYPLLAGLSRKSLLGEVLGRPVDERLAGSLTLAALAVRNGAKIVRVHDVAETRDMLTLLNLVELN